jgi:hypothetical protein
MFSPAPERRSSRIVSGMAMRSNRCICFNLIMSAMVVVGHGVRGNSVLCSIGKMGIAIDLRKSIVCGMKCECKLICRRSASLL